MNNTPVLSGSKPLLVAAALPVLASMLSVVPENSILMYVLGAVILALAFAALRMADAWHQTRVEVCLGAATIVAIWLAYFFSDASPALRVVLPGAVGVLAALFIGGMFVRLLPLVNRALRAK